MSARRCSIVGLLVTSALIAFGAANVGAKPKTKGKSTHGTVYIAQTPRSTTKLLYEAGNITDKVLGDCAITFTIKPQGNSSGTVTANAIKVTLWTKKGSLTGTGGALLTITNSPHALDVIVSKGKASLTKGTNGEKGHRFKITFTGSGNGGTGAYVFKYKGTYK